MDGSQLLRQAEALVEFGWCQGATARTVHGAPIDVCDHDAAEWSLLGALQAASFSGRPAELQDIRGALEAIADLIADPSLSHWNDAPERTQQEVLTLLAEAGRARAS